MDEKRYAKLLGLCIVLWYIKMSLKLSNSDKITARNDFLKLELFNTLDTLILRARIVTAFTMLKVM